MFSELRLGLPESEAERVLVHSMEGVTMRRIFEVLLFPIMMFFHGLIWLVVRARTWKRRLATVALG